MRRVKPPIENGRMASILTRDAKRKNASARLPITSFVIEIDTSRAFPKGDFTRYATKYRR